MGIIKGSKKTRNNDKAIFSSDIKNYAEEPFFVKKAEDARIAVSEIVLPEDKN